MRIIKQDNYFFRINNGIVVAVVAVVAVVVVVVIAKMNN